jgi:beta-lactamase superfamily II metal-dependent hydrolase
VTIAPLQIASLAATARDAQGNPVTGRPIVWTTGAQSVATVSDLGVVTATGVGTTSIAATVDGIQGSAAVTVTAVPLGNLQIHQINVGWGGSILVRGPNGTTVLLEGGFTGDGTASVVPYLKSIGIQPADGLDYTIVGHQHCDHLGGLDEVIQAGYGVRTKNYFNGSSQASSCTDQWRAAALTTTAGLHVVPPLGATISLGGGATLTFLAVNGSIIGGGHVTVSAENDRSIAALIKYGGFDFLWASDLGGGAADSACTGRVSLQADVETSLIAAISPGGSSPLISDGGIDVLVVNHHGSESSTNSTYMNRTRPAVALIGIGAGEAGLELPRRRVVENVLLAQVPCVTVPAAVVFQTEEGSLNGAQTSFAGFSVGDIRITTDGQSGFTVAGSGRVFQGPFEGAIAGLPRTFLLDDGMQPTRAARALMVAASGGYR